MGPDSVGLIVAIEKHFGITIPDPKAEQIATVGGAAACVARHLSIEAREGWSSYDER